MPRVLSTDEVNVVRTKMPKKDLLPHNSSDFSASLRNAHSRAHNIFVVSVSQSISCGADCRTTDKVKLLRM